ncbi:ATP-binding protein [Streptomyces sp. NPDC021212]|uniref:ATP-binding protein n=1 Tax=Streptomyces sp. NPDC021212 TaxID=3365118 RepID=UPI0037880524
MAVHRNTRDHTRLSRKDLPLLTPLTNTVSAEKSCPVPHSPATAALQYELLDRREELAVLGRLTERLPDRVSSVVCIEGAGGIGKTSLLNAWIAAARDRGLLVARVCGSESQEGRPWSAARRLFDSLLAALSESDRRALQESPAAQALSALSTPPGEEGRACGDQAEVSCQMSEILYELVVNACEMSPLALVLDDATWADQASLRWMHSLAGRIDGLPLMLVTTRRCGNGQEAAPLLDELALQPGVITLELSPLSPGSVRRLVQDRMDRHADEQFCAACHEACGGNPLLLNELLRVLVKNGVRPCAAQAGRVAELNEHVTEKTIAIRLARQSKAVMAMSRALAVLGDGTQLPVVAALAGLDPFRAQEAVREMRCMGVLTEEEHPRFTQPLIRSALFRAMAPGKLAEEHMRAARLLRDHGECSEEVARHLMLTQPTGDEWRIAVLRDAARRAAARGAPAISARYLRQALTEAPAPQVEVCLRAELATIELLDNPTASVYHFHQELLLRQDTPGRAAAVSGLAAALCTTRRTQEAVTALRQGLAELGESPEHGEWRLRLEAQLVLASWQDGSSASIGTELVKARSSRRVRGDTPGERAWLAVCALHAHAGHGTAEHARSLAGRALRGGMELDGAMLWFYPPLLLALVATDHPEMAAGWLQRMADHAARRGSGRLSALASLGLGTVAWHSGRVREGLGHARDLLDVVGRETPERPALPSFAVVANLLLDLGAADIAHDILQTHPTDSLVSDAWARSAYLLAHGRLRLEQGDPGAALASLLECGRYQEAGPVIIPAITRWRSYAALAYAATGDRASAIDMAERDLELSRRWGTHKAIGVSLRTLGTVTGGKRGLELLSQAVDMLEHSPARVELAYTLNEFGAACQRLARRDAARSSLQRALVVAEECSASCLADRVRGTLPLVGGRLRADKASDARRLTPSERRVAELAAQGRSNREISEALFVTRRTVEIHLTSAYRKLGISGRPELAFALAQSATPARQDRALPVP